MRQLPDPCAGAAGALRDRKELQPLETKAVDPQSALAAANFDFNFVAAALAERDGRERAILEGIAEGLDNSELAASLQMAEKTVRNHITRVFDKISVEHRYQAIVLAREAGLGRAGGLVNGR